MVYPIHRFRALADLTSAEVELLVTLGEPETVRRRGETFQREGDTVGGFHLHIRGWIASSIILRSGNRLIQKVHLPGDMLGTPTMVFDLPLTQEVIGDLLGLTGVHVNRTVRSLEEDGLIARTGHRVRLLDLDRLRQLSPLPPRQPGFEPAWLPAAR